MLIRIAAMFSASFAAAVQTHVADPLTQPIAASRAPEWLAPRPPLRVYGNTYLVGFGGLSVALIDSGAGLILIDGALPQAAPMILANVARLGFDPRDIKFILSTEPHFDHAGGLAALARDTGATVIASPRGSEGLRSGRLAADDPQLGYDSRFPPVAAVRIFRDRETLRLGNVVVTARATPGHTAGSMSWSWQSCEDRQCRSIVFAASLNPVSADGYRFTARSNRRVVDAFHRSYRVMENLPCNILITAHPSQGHVGARYSTEEGSCSAYAAASRRLLATRLANERAK